jgi:hypothetical protein
MATRTISLNRPLTVSWSLAWAPLKLWSMLRLLHESYAEALELARKAQRQGIFVE